MKEKSHVSFMWELSPAHVQLSAYFAFNHPFCSPPINPNPYILGPFPYFLRTALLFSLLKGVPFGPYIVCQANTFVGFFY